MSLRSRSENRPTTTAVITKVAPRAMYPSGWTWTLLITLHAGTRANATAAASRPARVPNSMASTAIGMM